MIQTESATLDEWQALVECHAESTAFHHRRWLELLRDQYGLRVDIRAVKQGGRLLAAIPFLETRGLLGPPRLVALPYTDCIRPLAVDPDALLELGAALHEDSFEAYQYVVVKTDRPVGPGSTPGNWMRHELDIARSIDQCARAFHPALRRNLRKAEQNGLQFQVRTDRGALETFYRLHLMTRRKLGVPVQPKRFFDRLWERILAQGLGRIGIVTEGDQQIAAAVFLTFNRRMIYKYGASDPRALAARPNEWLLYNAIRMASEEGYLRFDFGVTSLRSEGLLRFKRKWGAEESAMYDDYLQGMPRPALKDSPLTQLTSRALRHGPPVLCRAVGEIFYRFSQ